MSRSMEQIFHSNPVMEAAITPYISRYNNFIFNSVIMADTAVHPLSQSPYSVEFILLVARIGNAGTVNVWNTDSLITGAGVSLSAGDSMRVSLDNVAFDTCEAFARIMTQVCEREIVNPMARRSINTLQWSVLASAATQIVDIAFGLGPAR